VMELARARGYEIVERVILPEEFDRTQEVFLTGTAVEVTPVREIALKSGIRHFTPGEITGNLVRDYDALVQRPHALAAHASVSAA